MYWLIRQDIVVDIVTRLWGGQLSHGFDSCRARESLIDSIQTGTVTHPVSYSVGKMAFSLGIKWSGLKLTTYL